VGVVRKVIRGETESAFGDSLKTVANICLRRMNVVIRTQYCVSQTCAGLTEEHNET